MLGIAQKVVSGRLNPLAALQKWVWPVPCLAHPPRTGHAIRTTHRVEI
jgi:hypothetical protein